MSAESYLQRVSNNRQVIRSSIAKSPNIGSQQYLSFPKRICSGGSSLDLEGETQEVSTTVDANKDVAIVSTFSVRAPSLFRF